MGKKRPNQDIVTFYAPEGLKDNYKKLCSIKGASMTENLVAFMEREVEENRELLDMVREKLKGG